MPPASGPAPRISIASGGECRPGCPIMGYVERVRTVGLLKELTAELGYGSAPHAGAIPRQPRREPESRPMSETWPFSWDLDGAARSGSSCSLRRHGPRRARNAPGAGRWRSCCWRAPGCSSVKCRAECPCWPLQRAPGGRRSAPRGRAGSSLACGHSSGRRRPAAVVGLHPIPALLLRLALRSVPDPPRLGGLCRRTWCRR